MFYSLSPFLCLVMASSACWKSLLIMIISTTIILFPTLHASLTFSSFWFLFPPGPFPPVAQALVGRWAGPSGPSCGPFLGQTKKGRLTKVAWRGVWKRLSRHTRG